MRPGVLPPDGGESSDDEPIIISFGPTFDKDCKLPAFKKRKLNTGSKPIQEPAAVPTQEIAPPLDGTLASLQSGPLSASPPSASTGPLAAAVDEPADEEPTAAAEPASVASPDAALAADPEAVEHGQASSVAAAAPVAPPVGYSDLNRPRRQTARYAADRALAELKATRAKRAVAATTASAAARSPSPSPPPPVEVRPYVRPEDPSVGKLPAELLALLVAAGGPLASDAADPPDDVRTAVIPLLRGLLVGVKPALARLAAWDAGWEDAATQRRIERAKSRFIRGLCVLGRGEAVDWAGRGAYGLPWEDTLCLWHIHSTIVLGLPSANPVWQLIDRYTALNPNDVLSPGADPATERGAELVRQRWTAKGRLREIALGWLAAAEAYKEPYRFQHAAYLDLLRSHLLVLPPERDQPPATDGTLPHAVVLEPPATWPALRSALATWAHEAAALCAELGLIDRDKQALDGWG